MARKGYWTPHLKDTPPISVFHPLLDNPQAPGFPVKGNLNSTPHLNFWE